MTENAAQSIITEQGDTLEITSEEINTQICIDKVRHNAAGAVSTFTGTTRDFFQDKQVESLSYEAYVPMALKSLEKLCLAVRASYTGIQLICIQHRLGNVPVGMESVIIAVSAKHRDEAMHVCEDLINGLKRDCPIWKKEIYTDGTNSWKENCECGRSATNR